MNSKRVYGREVKTVAQVEELDWKEFSEGDWMGFQGCVRFHDGSAPLLATLVVDGHEETIIQDGEGLHVLLSEEWDHRGERPLELAMGYCAKLPRALAQLKKQTTMVELRALGFKVVS